MPVALFLPVTGLDPAGCVVDPVVTALTVALRAAVDLRAVVDHPSTALTCKYMLEVRTHRGYRGTETAAASVP